MRPHGAGNSSHPLPRGDAAAVRNGRGLFELPPCTDRAKGLQEQSSAASFGQSSGGRGSTGSASTCSTELPIDPDSRIVAWENALHRFSRAHASRDQREAIRRKCAADRERTRQ
eukprot:570671-Prymnesium_polylepis.1